MTYSTLLRALDRVGNQFTVGLHRMLCKEKLRLDVRIEGVLLLLIPRQHTLAGTVRNRGLNRALRGLATSNLSNDKIRFL